MCGFVRRVTDHPSVLALLLELGLEHLTFNGGDFYPGSGVDILLAEPEPRLQRATWWFLLEQDGRPNYRYATFNARHLDSQLWREPIRTSRCLIPATAFGESIGEGKQKRSYLLESKTAFLLGGVYRHYETAAGPVTAFAVITRDPHPRLKTYHDKSCPLFIPAQASVVQQWLDPGLEDPAVFFNLMEPPRLSTDFKVTPVKSTKKLVPVGDPDWVRADQ